MRMSQLFCKTWRQAPAEAELTSHRLILRAGLAYQMAAGIYSLTPLGYRVLHRIAGIIRDAMWELGGQEVLLPVVQPAEWWRASGRYGAAELMKLADRSARPFALALTNEEAVTQLAAAFIESYRQLPCCLFQIQTKVRDEARPRGGLIRLREFTMKDAYSFHASQADLDTFYDKVLRVYVEIFRRTGLPVTVVESDTGLMGGRTAHEFMLLTPGGEDTLLTCPACGYAANQEAATFRRNGNDSKPAAPRVDIYDIHTPGAGTIAELCQIARCQAEQTLKCVFFTAGGEVVIACIRGDLDVNSAKLARLLGQEARSLAPAEAQAAGLVTGYAGPVGLTLAVPFRIVADDSVPDARNMITGANRPDFHIGGVNYGRDFQAAVVGDIALATAGAPCPRCGAPLAEQRGIEMGNIFKLGVKYSSTFGLSFVTETGASQPAVMGCYGIGLERLLAGIVEYNHDADGIIWPASVAPYLCHLLVVGKDAAALAAADKVYETLGAERVLFDDREASTGVKLKDADLLGMPVRITLSNRSLAAGGAEVRLRRTGETQVVAVNRLAAMVEALAVKL